MQASVVRLLIFCPNTGGLYILLYETHVFCSDPPDVVGFLEIKGPLCGAFSKSCSRQWSDPSLDQLWGCDPQEIFWWFCHPWKSSDYQCPKVHPNQWHWKCRQDSPSPYHVWNVGEFFHWWLLPWWSDWMGLWTLDQPRMVCFSKRQALYDLLSWW